jgi:inosose dehydratase
VDDVSNPHLPHWERVLDEAAEAGFGGLELDPIGIIRRYAACTDYIHFKDIDDAKYIDVMGLHIRFFDACAEGVMCPIGRGRIDYSGLRELLAEIGYGGYITIEQERDPRNAHSALADLAASREFLRRVGF